MLGSAWKVGQAIRQHINAARERMHARILTTRQEVQELCIHRTGVTARLGRIGNDGFLLGSYTVPITDLLEGNKVHVLSYLTLNSHCSPKALKQPTLDDNNCSSTRFLLGKPLPSPAASVCYRAFEVSGSDTEPPRRHTPGPRTIEHAIKPPQPICYSRVYVLRPSCISMATQRPDDAPGSKIGWNGASHLI